MKYILLAIAIASLTGCPRMNGMPTNDPQISNDSRWAAAADIARVKYKALEAKYAMETARLQALNNIPTATITTMDSGGKPVTVSINVAPLIEAVKDSHGKYKIQPDVMPKGAFAEIIDSVFNGGAKLADTSALAVGIPLAIFGQAIRPALERDTYGGDANITKSFNNSNSGDESPIGNGGDDDFIREVPVIDNTGDAVPDAGDANTISGPYPLLPGDY